MPNHDDAQFGEGFLDDFFAEADEHLAVIRRDLLALEAALTRGSVSPATLEEMFRSFHSLKGLSGMVQLEKSELLAHDMESYLRALRQGETKLSAEGVEALIDGTRALEEVVAARRNHEPEPSIDHVRARIAAVVPAAMQGRPAATRERGRPSQAGEPDARALAAPPAAPAWRIVFSPSTELLARGINVNVIRERLRGIGEIVEARPRVTDSGGIAFEFLLATRVSSDALDAWRADGLTYEPASEEDAPPPERPIEIAPEPPEPSLRLASAGTPAASTAASRFVRVDLARLDEVMRLIADIVVTRGRLDDGLERLESRLPHSEWRPVQDASQALERQMRMLRESVMRVRLVPVREIFSKMPFVVRDLARDGQKQVRLDLRGQGTEIDKFVIERMMDPILHLVRNAIVHGIEPPDERIAAGKPPVGIVGLRAATLGESVVIEIEDDGRGIDRDRVVAHARAAGLPVPERVDSEALLELLCASGLSTQDEADRASGRGIGMAVVKQVVEQLSGIIDVDTEPGRGTRFILTMPVTLAIIDALLCRVGTERFAVPQSAVREVLELPIARIEALENNEIFRYRDGVLPLVRLSRILRLEEPPAGPDAHAANGRLHVFVVGSGLQAVGLGVDRIIGQREVVVRSASDPLIHVPGLAGATELGDGRPVLVLDPFALARVARRAIGQDSDARRGAHGND